MKPASFTLFGLALVAGCQTGGAAGTAGGPPQAAIDACLQNADAYQGVAPGTATYDGQARADVALDNPAASGDYWGLHVTVKGVAFSCTVTSGGKVMELDAL
jgi:hypothetical protein